MKLMALHDLSLSLSAYWQRVWPGDFDVSHQMIKLSHLLVG
jgi:hypothetical protein